ncbi:hypothetical protein D3C76_1728310 [compost metagenome]
MKVQIKPTATDEITVGTKYSERSATFTLELRDSCRDKSRDTRNCSSTTASMNFTLLARDLRKTICSASTA